ncbi:MAG: T9SS type A sorting domain-containing protein, partial [Sphingobacteriia bacterium]|nr:T9SS type A sorting domain-containing protein [Sphingobacteriia bacterium]
DVDAFLAKYNSDGTLAWAKTVGGNGDDRGTALVSDSDGNIYITGGYESSSINFGAATLTNSETYKDYMYVAKYNTSGTNLWAKSAYSVGARTYGAGISLDQSGNCYVGGVFDGTIANFGTHTITNNKPGGSNAWIAKYNNSGVEQWAANAISGPEGNQNYCITTDNIGNSYISGWFTSPTVTFGSIVLNSTAYGDNIFLVKYNSNGQVTNAYAFKGSGMSGGYGNAICCDNNGNAYLTGYFEGTNMTFGTTTLTNTGSYDVYWTKASLGATSIREIELTQNLNVYPNPATNYITIESEEWMNNAKIFIFNAFGQKVFEKDEFNGNQLSINISEFPSGIYSVSVNNNVSICKRIFVVTK